MSSLGGTGAAGGRGDATPATTPRAKLKPNKVDSLSDHERKLLSDLRESLFERHSNMKLMFEKMDKDQGGLVDIEEFLKAMEHAGSVSVQGPAKARTHEIDRGAATITEEEACNIIGFSRMATGG